MSDNITDDTNLEHQAVWTLLPWFVNQSLGTQEQRRVNNHIKTCLTCRIELKQQQQVYAAMQQTDLLQQMSQASFHQLQKRIAAQSDAQQSAHAPTRVACGTPHPIFFRFSGIARYLAVAAVLVLLTTAVIFNNVFNVNNLESEYRTLSSSATSQSVHRDGELIRVIFRDKTDNTQINAIVQSLSGEIVSGPLHNGIYEIRFDRDQQSHNQTMTLADTIERLRDNDQVIFAEMAHVSLTTD